MVKVPSERPVGHKRGRRLVRVPGSIVAAAAICAVSLAACSSSSSSSPEAAQSAASSTAAASAAASGGSASDSSCTSTATQAVQAAETPPSLPASLSALPASGADKLKGKLVVAVPQSESFGTDIDWVNGLKAATAAVGANLRIIDGQGTPSGEAQALSQAATLKPAAVLTWAITITAAPSAFQMLKSKGIPVVTDAGGWPVSSYSTDYPYAINNAMVGVGKLEADYALSKSNCNLHAAVFTSSIFPSQVAVAASLRSEVSSLCSSCTTSLGDVAATSLATAAGPQAVAAVQSNRATNFIIPTYAAMLGYMIPALKQAGMNVSTVSAIGSDQNVTLVEQGAQSAEIESYPTAEFSWFAVDDALRALNGLPPGPWSGVPSFIFTSANAAQAKQYLATGSAGYQDKFKQLWGVSS
jgi:ribose transport system substrate-binding protein